MVKKRSKKKKRSRSAGKPARGSGLLLALVGMGLAIGGQFLLSNALPGVTSQSIFGWLGLALGAAVMVRAVRWASQVNKTENELQVPRLVEAGLLLLIVLFALGARTYNLDHQPNAGYRDEAESGNVAIQIMEGADNVSQTGTDTPVYIENVYQNAASYFYPAALIFKVLGVDIKHVRYNSVFWGTLAVASFYFLARAMLGAPLALFLTLCLAGLRWHINFSRTGMIGSQTVALQIPALYFLWKGLRAKMSDPLKKYPNQLLAVGLALGIGATAIPFVKWGWSGFGLRALMLTPLLIALVMARHDRRSLFLMLSGAAVAFCMYSYISSRLVMISVIVIYFAWMVRDSGAFEGKALRVTTFWLIVAALGAASIVQGSVWAQPWMGTLGRAVVVVGVVALFVRTIKLMKFHKRQMFQRWIRPLGLALGGALIVGAPLFNYMTTHWTQMFSRTSRVSVFNDREYDKRAWGIKLKENIRPTLSMYNHLGDGNPRHNYPGDPMLNPLLALFFALGVFMAIRWVTQPLAFFLLLWWQVLLMAGYYSIEAPQAFRTFAACIPVLLFAGIGLKPLIKVGHAVHRKAWPALLLLLVILAVFSVKQELYNYFVRQPTHPGVWAEFSAGEFMMAKRIKSYPNTRGLLRPDWSDSWTVKFVTWPERDYEYFDLPKHVPLKDHEKYGPNKNFLYVLGAAYRPLIPLLKDYYPNGELHEAVHAINGEPIHWSYYVPASDIAALELGDNGLLGRYWRATKEKPKFDGKPRFERNDPFLLFNWTVSPLPGFFSAEWTGKIDVPTSGEYSFWTHSNNYARIDIDGQKVVERQSEPLGNRWKEGKIYLTAGKHRIRVRYWENSNYSRMEMWWQPPGKEKAVVPGRNLFPGKY